MKLNKIVSAFVLASGVMVFGAQADQGSGVVTFTGSVIDAPCSIAAGDEDQTISLGQVSRLNLKSSTMSELRWLREEQCLDKNSLHGMEIRVDLSKDTLYLSIPQAYIEFTAPNWDPPARLCAGSDRRVALGRELQ